MSTVPAPDLRRLTDAEIWDRLHHGAVDSALHRQCVFTLQMRSAERQAQAAAQQAGAADALVTATNNLAAFTKNLMRATWALFVVGGATARAYHRAGPHRIEGYRAMIAAIGASLVVFALAMALPSQASAECAWVLWSKHEALYVRSDTGPESSLRWELEKAYATHFECESAKQLVWRALSERYTDLSKWQGVERVDRVPYEGIIVTLKPRDGLLVGSQSRYLLCLPDTLGPRGVKGGGN